MAFAKVATDVSPGVAERRVKELLAKAQRRAAGLDIPSSPTRCRASSSGSSGDRDAEVEVVKVKEPRSKQLIKASLSSGSDSDSNEDVKPNIVKSSGVVSQELAVLTRTPKRSPSSDSSSESEPKRKPELRITRISFRNPSETPKTKASSSKPIRKRKRNSILPVTIINPWKRKAPEPLDTSSDQECPVKASKMEISFKEVSSSESEDERPLRPVPILQKKSSSDGSKKLPKSSSSSSDSSSSEESDNDNEQDVQPKVAPNETASEGADTKKPASDETEVVADTEYFQTLGTAEVGKKKAPVVAAVPKWVQRAVRVSAKVESLGDLEDEVELLGTNLVAALRQNGIQGLFPIQKQVIRSLLDKRVIRMGCPPRDICVAAPTGSGKTLAFILPLIRLLENKLEKLVRAVILLPTAELVKQVFDVFSTFAEGTNVRAAMLAGYKSRLEEEKLLLKKGHSLVDVVVATPAKFLQHLRATRNFSVQQLEMLILDEADRMVDMIQYGLIQEIEDAVFTKRPDGSNLSVCRCSGITIGRPRPGAINCCLFDASHTPLRKLLYSATLMSDPEKLKHLNLFYPKVFHASHIHERILQNAATADDTSQERQPVKPIVMSQLALTLPDKLEERWMACDLQTRPLLVWWLATRKAHSHMLVFTRTREECHRLRVVIEHMGDCRVIDLSADMKKRKRHKALQDFDNGLYDVLICTALLARGMDLANVEHVLLYHSPRSAEEYVHTVGRTARANRHGISIVLINEQEERHLKKTLKVIANSKIKPYLWNAEELTEFYGRYQQALALAKKELLRKS
ncbi:ATP-dependent RNA helicase DDX51-like [Varroa jacobsoni]|uniref:ATP-dependent RNA helicase DDX51-like n=1 Tax=Varroa jacobsoni TaxID=62625 RepID=UPI000BF60621|nr:ATP-dependent RNA helicase DDX51-like [Varroa jacobsoni]